MNKIRLISKVLLIFVIPIYIVLREYGVFSAITQNKTNLVVLATVGVILFIAVRELKKELKKSTPLYIKNDKIKIKKTHRIINLILAIVIPVLIIFAVSYGVDKFKNLTCNKFVKMTAQLY